MLGQPVALDTFKAGPDVTLADVTMFARHTREEAFEPLRDRLFSADDLHARPATSDLPDSRKRACAGQSPLPSQQLPLRAHRGGDLLNTRKRQPDNLGNRSYPGPSFIGFLDGAIPVLASSNVGPEFLGQALLLFEPLSPPMPSGSGIFSPPRRLAREDFADKTIERLCAAARVTPIRTEIWPNERPRFRSRISSASRSLFHIAGFVSS